MSAQRSSRAAGVRPWTPSQTWTASSRQTSSQFSQALRPVSQRISLRAFMPWKNSTGKLSKVASGSPSRTSPLWVNAMLTVDCGLLSQRWPVVMCGMICPMKSRPVSGPCKFQQQIPGERKVVAAQHESLYIGDVQINHVVVLRVRPASGWVRTTAPCTGARAHADALRIRRPAVPARGAPCPGTGEMPPGFRRRTFPGWPR